MEWLMDGFEWLLAVLMRFLIRLGIVTLIWGSCLLIMWLYGLIGISIIVWVFEPLGLLEVVLAVLVITTGLYLCCGCVFMGTLAYLFLGEAVFDSPPPQQSSSLWQEYQWQGEKPGWEHWRIAGEAAWQNQVMGKYK